MAELKTISRYKPLNGEVRTRKCVTCEGVFIKPLCMSVKQWNKRNFCSISCSMNGRRNALGGGHKLSEETKKKMSLYRQKFPTVLYKESNPAWKGGVVTLNRKARNCAAAKKWRDSVLRRDDYTCQRCGKKEVVFEVHHIKSFSEHPDLRYEIDNGVTLCRPCHITVDKFRAQFIFIKK